MAIIQGSDLNNVFSKLNATAASIEKSGNDIPHIVFPYFSPLGSTVRGQQIKVIIYVTNVDFGADVNFGPNVTVSDVKYFTYKNTKPFNREQISTISFKASEIECLITLPPQTVISNNSRLPVTITNLNGITAQNDTDFTISDLPTIDTTTNEGSLILNINTSISGVGITHKNGQRVNDTKGSQKITIPYNEIPKLTAGSLTIELRDNDYIPLHYFRVSIENNIIFVEKYDSFLNQIIQKVETNQQLNNTNTNLDFEFATISGDKKPFIFINNITPIGVNNIRLDKINAFKPLTSLEVNYQSNYSNVFRYELIGELVDRMGGAQETIKSGELSVNDSKIFQISVDSDLQQRLTLYKNFIIKLTPYYFLKLVSGSSQNLKTISGNINQQTISVDQVYNFSIDITKIEATEFGGDFKVKINVENNLEWRFTEDTTSQEFSWITPVELVGSRGSKEVTLRVKPNITSINRTTRLQLRSRNGTPSLLAEISVTQKGKTQDFSLVNFWFDFDPNKNTGPFPNTKDSTTDPYSSITVPYYTKEGSNELLILNGSNRTNPISLYGVARSQTGTGGQVPLIFRFKKSDSELDEGEFYVSGVVGFQNTNFNPNGFWGDSNIDFSPIPQQVRESKPTDLQIVQFTIKYKVNNTIGEKSVYYRLKRIEELKPTFTTNPDRIVAKVDYKSKVWFGFSGKGSAEILGKTKVGIIKPVVSVVTDRNSFSIESIKFYRNWEPPTSVMLPTEELTYINASNSNNSTPNVYNINFTGPFSDNREYIDGVVKIKYKNNLGDISDHIIKFPVLRSDVFTLSYFNINPKETFIDVNKSFEPIIKEINQNYKKFEVRVDGYDVDSESTPSKNINYGYTPFEPGPGSGRGMFSIRSVELNYENPTDRVEIIAYNSNDIRYGFQSKSQDFGHFDVNVYRLSGKVTGKVKISYRNFNQNVPPIPSPTDEYLYFEIVPRREDDPEPPGPPPPPLPPTYTVSAKPNADLNIQVDCNNSILSGNLPVLISAIQINKNNSSDSKSLFYRSNGDLSNGEFRILSVVSDSENLNFNIDSAQSTINLVTDFLHKNYVATVTIEYKDDNSNLDTTTTTFKINRVQEPPYVINFKPDTSSVAVSVDYESTILGISDNLITITGTETNSRRTGGLIFTAGQLTKGTFKVKKIEGLLVANPNNLSNNIPLKEDGILTVSGTINVYIDYIDSCGKSGSSIVTVSIIRIPPKGQEVFSSLTPTNVDVFVDFRFSLVQRPLPFTDFKVELSEREIETPFPPRKMMPVIRDVLNKNEFKIIKVYDSSNNKVIESYDIISPDTFRPFVKKLLNSENSFVEIRYKDLSGKEGTVTLPFTLNRIQLPREESAISIQPDPQQQQVIVSDKFEIIDQSYDEIRDIYIKASEILANKVSTKSLTYVKLKPGEKLRTDGLNDSNYTINTIYAYEQNQDGGIGKFIDYIGFDIDDGGTIRVLANTIKVNTFVKINLSYVDNYGNEGSRELLARILPVVTPPLITRIEYPEGINAQDYAGFNVDFDVNFESEFTTNVSIYVNVDEKTYNQNSFYGKYKSDDFAKFNMDDLIKRFNINTGPENDTFTFTLVLVPERLEPDNKILIGQIEVIEIIFNKSDIQIPRPYIINNLNTVIKPKFDFRVYKDEVAKYLNHYLHFDNYEPRLIANWERDDITFSEFELDELGNEIAVEENPTLILKMYEPLPEEIQPNTSIWISKQRS